MIDDNDGDDIFNDSVDDGKASVMT